MNDIGVSEGVLFSEAKPRVLCVDDEPSVLQILALSLQREFQVALAASGEEGVALLATGATFAVVISDVYMPGMDGLAFLHHVHRERPDVICILLTGAQDIKSEAAVANTVGIFRYLIKPCTLVEIRQAVSDGVAQYARNRAEFLLNF